MILLIFMFRCIIYWWYVWSVFSGRQVWAAWSQEPDHEVDIKDLKDYELQDLKIHDQTYLQHEQLIQNTEQKDKRIEELELKHEELIQNTEQKDKRIEELEFKQKELIRTQTER